MYNYGLLAFDNQCMELEIPFLQTNAKVVNSDIEHTVSSEDIYGPKR